MHVNILQLMQHVSKVKLKYLKITLPDLNQTFRECSQYSNDRIKLDIR